MTDDAPDSMPRLAPDSIATALGGAGNEIPEGYISFKGYLGPAVDGMHRIYLDNSFWKWLSVRGSDIKFREDVPANERDPRSVFWVERQAKVVVCQVDLAHEIEDDVWGTADDTAAYRRPPY